MYTILCDDELIYSPGTAGRGYFVSSPKLTTELNKASTLKFTLPPGAVGYDRIQKLQSNITAYDGDKKIFHGRCIDSTEDFYKQRSMQCEGELGFLNDSVLRPYEFSTGSPAEIFTYYVTQHNSVVNADRRFVVGDVSEMEDDQIVRSSTQYPTTMEELQEKLIENYGGYVTSRYVGDDIYLDYRRISGGNNSQVIRFGTNLLDLSKYINAADVKTILIPLGAEIEDEESETSERLTIKEVNDGKDYIESQTAISIFGRIEACEVWDDVNTPSILLQRGQHRITELISEATTLSIKAVDLSLIDVDSERLKLGEYNRVVSAPHDLDAYFQCTKITIDMTDPSKSEYTFGNPRGTLSGRVAEMRAYGRSLKQH